MLDAIATEYDREIQVEAAPEFHVQDIRYLRARTRKEITHDTPHE
jgi:hypothetical protein